MKRRISIVLVVIFVVVIGAFTIYAKTSDTKSNKEEVKLGFMSNIKELSEISAIMDLVEENFVNSNPDKNYFTYKTKGKPLFQHAQRKPSLFFFFWSIIMQ